MTTPNMSFDGEAIAKGYDDYLVPVMFDPWAERLIERVPPHAGATVLDLATGTGIVAKKLAERLGVDGKIYGVDLNTAMMRLAKERCADISCAIEFVESSAEAIDLPDASVDYVYCQQGFQFFPDKQAAAREIYRLLRPGGRAILTTWLPLSECPFFGAICTALNECDEPDIAAIMARPFDHMPADELRQPFDAQPFAKVQLEQDVREMCITGGIERAYQTVFGTPIAPLLEALPNVKQEAFRNAMLGQLEKLRGEDGITYGHLVTHVLIAEKG